MGPEWANSFQSWIGRIAPHLSKFVFAIRHVAPFRNQSCSTATKIANRRQISNLLTPVKINGGRGEMSGPVFHARRIWLNHGRWSLSVKLDWLIDRFSSYRTITHTARRMYGRPLCFAAELFRHPDCNLPDDRSASCRKCTFDKKKSSGKT